MRNALFNVPFLRHSDLAQGFFEQLAGGTRKAIGHFLGEAGDGQTGPPSHIAAIGRVNALHDFQERGLARAVAAQESNAFSPLNGEVYAVQQGRPSKGEREIRAGPFSHGD